MMKSKSDTSDSKKRMIEALEKNKGVVTFAAEDAGIHRSTHYEWYDEDPDYKTAVDGIKPIGLDYAKRQLFKLMEGDGIDPTTINATAVIFYLKTQGKNEGFTERTEVTGAEGKDLIPKIVIEIIGGTENKSE